MMEWGKQHYHHNHRGGGVDAAGINQGDVNADTGLMITQYHQHQQPEFVVMTDYQIEILRKQIAVYTILCDKLFEMHQSFSSQRDLSGVRIGNMFCDPLMISSSHKISARQRWAPTPAQLRILENIFDKGNGTPNKEKIKDITSQLIQHGQVSENNVYNWFQNRRARVKRKQAVPAASNNKTDGSKEMKAEENFQCHRIPMSLNDDSCYRGSEMSSEFQSFEPLSCKTDAMFSSEDDLKLKQSTTLGDMSFYDSILLNRRVDQLAGGVDVEGDFHPYHHTDDYHLMC